MVFRNANEVYEHIKDVKMIHAHFRTNIGFVILESFTPKCLVEGQCFKMRLKKAQLANKSLDTG